VTALAVVILTLLLSPFQRELFVGDETVRSHLKKVQIKLGVRNRAHAVAEALRQNLIP